MPANTQPIFPLTPNVSWGKVLTANTALTGAGTSSLLFTAGANGARIDQIKVRHLGTNVASVLRLFVNNGLAPATVDNNALIHEVQLLANTIVQNNSSLDIDITVPKDDGASTPPPIPYLPAGYRIYGTVGTSIAAGVMVTIHGGDY